MTAKHLVEDFPRAKFVHTIRDPITTCDRTFQHFLPFADRNIALPYSVLDSLVGDDRPQFGMESERLQYALRTCIVIPSEPSAVFVIGLVFAIR